jgi:hypothetical protein
MTRVLSEQAQGRRQTPAPLPDAPQPADPVGVAFRLGWHVAELYARDIARQQPAAPERPPHALPGLSALSRHDRDLLLAAQIEADVHVLAPELAAAGITPADCSTLVAGLQDLAQSEAAVKLALYEFHRELLTQLWAADFRLGKAYGLGRSLSDTSLLPSIHDAASFGHSFDVYRIGQLSSWLDDLGSTFPDHAAQAVRQSLESWRAWAAAWTAPADGGSERPAPVSDDVDRLLREQGRLWRELLSGEKEPADLLAPADYIAAAEQMLVHTRALAKEFVRRRWLPIAVAAAVFAGLIAVIAHFTSGGSQAAGIIATTLGTLGVSWKAVGATLGKLLRRVEQPLWDNELARAAAAAVDRTPPPVDANQPVARTR